MERPRPAPTSWICDTCKTLIRCPAEGWLEWIDRCDLREIQTKSHSLRLVHAYGFGPHGRNCQYNERAVCVTHECVGDAALPEFLGPDGLTRLLEMVAEQRFELDEIIVVVQRLFTPHFEQARHHFSAALAEGVIEHDVRRGFWRQTDLQRVLEFAACQDA